MKRLENKTAIVTGGNSGIGKATAILFAKEGADLVLCARRKEALDEVAEECRKYGVQVVTVKADVSSHEDCSAVVKAAVDTFGKVDILVNNAGIVDKHRPITECTDEWWDEIIAIDQSSLFYMMKDTIPHMMASGKGSIINVSSIGGVFGIYELLPAFLVGLVLMVIVSLCTKAPSKEITDEFDRVKAMGKAK